MPEPVTAPKKAVRMKKAVAPIETTLEPYVEPVSSRRLLSDLNDFSSRIQELHRMNEQHRKNVYREPIGGMVYKMTKSKKPKNNGIKKALNALDRREEFARLAKDRTKRALTDAYRTNQGEMDRLRGAGAHNMPGFQQHLLAKATTNAGILRKKGQLQ